MIDFLTFVWSTMKVPARSFWLLLRAKLSLRVAFWVFLSIVLIEVIIFIPSYARREQELIEQVQAVSTAKVAAVFQLVGDDQSAEQVARQFAALTYYSDIVGYAVYTTDGRLVGSLGEQPRMVPQDLTSQEMGLRVDQSGQRLDVAWARTWMRKNYVVVLRHDISHVQAELKSFGLRIAGLVVIISLFVTVTTMAVLGKLVILPILRLRDDLHMAGMCLDGEVDRNSFYSFSLGRRDELGDVMGEFRQMYDRVRSAIAIRAASENALRAEKAKSEELLLNILPKPIAERLKQQEAIADGYAEVTVLFADIVGFTELSGRISPQEVVELLNDVFSMFDHLSQHYGLEKIKTIGDAYMVAAGLPNFRPDHAQAIADMALAMQAQTQQFYHQSTKIDIRIGINTGPVVAGVIGRQKFSYDLWGDTVNVAARMESTGMPGKIQVTQTTYAKLKTEYEFEERGLVTIKGKGEMLTYWLIGRRFT
jgi:class 3 adenylate cyclase